MTARDARIFILLLAALMITGCSDDSDLTPDGSLLTDLALEASPAPDSGKTDASASEDTSLDAFSPLPGVGKISGHCGVLDDVEWKSNTPFLFRNTLDLGANYAFDEKKLSAGGQQIFKDGNLGGSSVHSEIFAHEVLHRCELAKLLKSESKITYKSSGGKKTDMLLQIDARKVGISVTRAYHYPPTQPYTEAEASKLLDKKLSDLPKSKANAAAADAWTRSMLHVLAYDKQHADVLQAAWKKQSASSKGDAILVVTVTNGKDDVIY